MKSNSYEPQLPEGTVTFLFTDIEGSTKLLNELGDQYASLLAEHRRILREIFINWHGQEVDVQGDLCFFTFPRASDVIAAVVEAQKAFAKNEWPEKVEVRVRMGLHTGEPLVAEGGYVGMDVHRAARIGALGHGGQVLLSEATTVLIRNELPESISLLDLGKHRLKDIPQPEQIHQLVIEGLPSEFPPLKSLEVKLPPHNLPRQSTPFVGRGPELEVLDAMMGDPEVRLISIVAAGGMGKTRIALASSEKQIAITDRTNGKVEFRFPDGVYFVPLAPLESSSSILPAIAEVLNFQILSGEGRDLGAGTETRTPKKQLLDYLRSKRLLLVMDNFEHLLEGVGLVSEIISAAPEVKILATSRERLNLKGEHLFPLLGMRFPDLEKHKTAADMDHESYSALALFEQTAQRIQPDFHITEQAFTDVVSICRLVDGMPLGIELAASWVNLLTLEKITKEIQGSLDFLETKLRDVDERHRSMRAVFDSTWDRLSHPERDLFERLTVFQGGFTIDAAVEVTGASLYLLGNLATRSLLQFDRTRGTYEIHELLRQFGAERLGQELEKERDVRDRHSAYYCERMSQLEPSLKGSSHVEAMDMIEAEIENITVAWYWAAEHGQIKLMTNALEAMDVYYSYSGRWEEGEEAFRYALEVLPANQTVETLRLRVRLNTLEARYLPVKRMEHKRILIEKSWELIKSPPLSHEDTRLEEANLLRLYGHFISYPMEASSYFQKAYDVFNSLDDRWKMALLLAEMGNLAQGLADGEGTIHHTKKSLEIFRELGFEKQVARCLARLSSEDIFQMEFESAERYLQESVEICEKLEDRRTLGWILLFVGWMRIMQGRFDEAYRNERESIEINTELGQTWNTVYDNHLFAQIEKHLGRYQEAFEFAQKEHRVAEEENFEWLMLLSLEDSGKILMGKGDYKEGRKFLEAAVELARATGNSGDISWTLPYLGICMHRLGDYVGMREAMYETLQINTKIRRLSAVVIAFPALALLQLVKGDVVRAIEYYAYAASHRYVADSKFFHDIAGRHIEAATESLPQDIVAAAQERGRNLDPHEVIQELLLEMEVKEEGGEGE